MGRARTMADRNQRTRSRVKYCGNAGVTHPGQNTTVIFTRLVLLYQNHKPENRGKD